jgi:hypothetical protein
MPAHRHSPNLRRKSLYPLAILTARVSPSFKPLTAQHPPGYAKRLERKLQVANS